VRSKRWKRAAFAGGRPLDPERWRAIVDQAVDRARPCASEFPERISRKPRLEIVEPGDVVLHAYEVLGLEMRLVEAEQLANELLTIADEDVDKARADRIRALIGRSVIAVENVLRQRYCVTDEDKEKA
jgi:hypothetical protein